MYLSNFKCCCFHTSRSSCPSAHATLLNSPPTCVTLTYIRPPHDIRRARSYPFSVLGFLQLIVRCILSFLHMSIYLLASMRFFGPIKPFRPFTSDRLPFPALAFFMTRDDNELDNSLDGGGIVGEIFLAVIPLAVCLDGPVFSLIFLFFSVSLLHFLASPFGEHTSPLLPLHICHIII